MSTVFSKPSLRTLSIAASVLLLTACSTTQRFTTQTTSFQQWPANAQGQLYRFEAGAGQDLEKASYVTLLRNQMWKTGLVEAVGKQKARFEVAFGYGVQSREQLVRETDPFYDPFFYPSFNVGWGWGARHPFYSGVGFAMAPQYRYVQASYNRYQLHVSIRDLQNSGAEVYQATVVADSNKANLTQVMPFLTASVFDGFPGKNGQVRKINFDIEKNERN
ncbi:DUF4136 domain-containing protein [Advenella sp. RU8]|uniref:DUF4136 domain-containing protein n=1 Tax=Advenella sp. RU8 TaxID=3399575 RepID=UPI003AAFA588